MPRKSLNKRKTIELQIKKQLVIPNKEIIESLKPTELLKSNKWRIKSIAYQTFSIRLTCQTCGRTDVFNKIDTELAQAFYNRYSRIPYKCVLCE